MVELIGFLVIFPLAAALALLFIKQDGARDIVVYASAGVIAIASIAVVALNIKTPGVYYPFESGAIDIICTIVGVLVAGVVLWFAWTYRSLPAAIAAGVLAIIQVVGTLIFDFTLAHGVTVEYGLYLDSLSLLMALIIGLVGTGICVYALGYMKDFQKHHADEPDRRPLFFAIMFLFLSAMYVIIFANNMSWLLTGWEVTTVCSFLLIGFTRTDEAIRNAFRQIIMNILGGLGFLVALYTSVINLGTLSFIDFLQAGVATPALAVVPVTCLAFAGLTKAAQMPFHTWLLGAMVAPTPTSALLHSSTMVKAGVFMLIKLAPVLYVCTVPATMVMLVGGITFCLASGMAISQTNAKRVLAYSTVANLGLIVACAGVGTPEAVWAASFLVLFHAVAKSLLFLCVGTAEHHIGSRDIEDMDLLFERMPRLAHLMMLGILGMFIAPFGMLISKWATLVSFVQQEQVALLIMLAFGSAVTFMFWAKWLGKLAGIAAAAENVEKTVNRSEWIALYIMALLLVLCTVLLPIVSDFTVMPYIESVFGPQGPAIGNDILFITGLLSVVLIIVIFGGFMRTPRNTRKLDVYLAGVGTDDATRSYRNALSQTSQAQARNMYLPELFGEQRLRRAGELVCGLVIVAALIASMLPIGIA